MPYIRKGIRTRFNDFLNRYVSVSRKTLLAAQDVNIVTKKKMRIYSTLNLVCFLIELAVFFVLQWVDDLTSLRIFVFKEES